jgi:mannan endo-1,4-beta-mannosidase
MQHLRTKMLLCLLVIGLYGSAPAQFKNFVTRQGDRLMDGDRTFRFISLNVPNLHYIEDNLGLAETNPWRISNEFEIRDALSSIKQLGGKVARIYVLSVRRPTDGPEIIRHVEGPGKFNEEAFKGLDRALQIANEVGVRLIIPFVDNWKWWGGPADYAAMRDRPGDAFWTDPQLISDIESTIHFVTNRINTLTGIAYKDDKAILAWETGNELRPPFSWTREIAAYVKSQDRNHLLLEGVHYKDLSTEALEDPNLDILSSHHYGDPRISLEAITANAKMARGRKPYIVGEYGLIPTQDLLAITDTIIHQGITGGMVWSLRFRNRDGGFYFHHEYYNYSAYHWPGFPTGTPYDERVVLSILRTKAFEIDSAVPPRLLVPPAPVLLESSDVSALSWRGSVGAQSYSVERKDADSSAWRVVAQSVDECRVQYRPLFSDETVDFGKRYFYRVQARNESGTSEYSNVIGPIGVSVKTLVDDMESFDRVFQKDGYLTLLTLQDIRRAKEERNRLTGQEGSYIMYKIPGDAWTIKVDALCTNDNSNVSIAADSALGVMKTIPLKIRRFHFGANDYEFYDSISCTSDQLPSGIHFVKIMLHDGLQICRVEIAYGPASRSGGK